MTKEKVLVALSTVEEPDLKKDLVSLNMVRDLRIEAKDVRFTVMLTTPACPLKNVIQQRCINAIQKVQKDISVHIDFDAEVTSIRQEPILQGVKNIIAVASGKGGVGKSTISTHLAITLAKKGAKVGLIDADIFGPSVPTMFKTQTSRPGIIKVDGKNKIVPIEQYGVKLLSIGYLSSPTDAMVWRGPMASSALKQFMSDAEWGELDYLLIDLPPGTSDIHLTMVQSVRITAAVIVTTPQKVAMEDAVRGIEMFRMDKINVPVLGIVENMAYFTPKELPDNKYYIFGKNGGKVLAERYDVPLLAQIPIVQEVRECADTGEPMNLDEQLVKYFEEASEQIARQVAIVNAGIRYNQQN